MWREDNLPYLAAAGNHPIGANHFNTMSKRHAKVFGFTNWKKNTSHGKRSKGVTAIHNADGVGAGTKHRVSGHKILTLVWDMIGALLAEKRMLF